jgi:hypothetical protein
MAEYVPQGPTHKVEQDLSEYDTRQENQTATERDIARIFQELHFLKKRLANVETQVMEIFENLGNVARPHGPVKPLPEL